MCFQIQEKGGIKYLTFDRLEQLSFIKHGFSTRIGGYSTGCFSSLNMGINTDDDENKVIKNIKSFCGLLDCNFNNMVMSKQIHKDNVWVVKTTDAGSFDNDEGIDALITNVPGIPLMTYYADCVPLFLVDPVKKSVGLAHAGWPGTLSKIGNKTVYKMIEAYNSDPKDIIVAIGPSIGSCCYEVGEDVVERFNTNFTNASAFVKSKDNGKYMLDLQMANSLSLKEIDILDRNIINCNLCTGCNTHLYYSHRIEKALTGRMAAIIEISY